MGELINLNPGTGITDADIPAAIARDTEYQAADAAHVAATDPHTQYLNTARGDARYRRSAAALTDGDIPSVIARDTEVTAAITAHTSAADPHPQYLLPSEGDTRYLGITAKATDTESVDGIDSSRIVFGEDWHKAIGASVNIESVFYASGFLDCYSGGGTFPAGAPHITGFQARHGNSAGLWGMQAGCKHDINNEFFFRTVTSNLWQPWRRVWNDGNFTPSSHPQTFIPTVKAVNISTGTIATANPATESNYCGL
ncbi:hypothetical protein, partial [Microcoleus sp. herbarium5]|uniref:hypothetical protein n=1 Tax=Microcoleus sp. herbarium5 TaxID=3055434 RepID=UPI002FD5F0DB